MGEGREQPERTTPALFLCALEWDGGQAWGVVHQAPLLEHWEVLGRVGPGFGFCDLPQIMSLVLPWDGNKSIVAKEKSFVLQMSAS